MDNLELGDPSNKGYKNQVFFNFNCKRLLDTPSYVKVSIIDPIVIHFLVINTYIEIRRDHQTIGLLHFLVSIYPIQE